MISEKRLRMLNAAARQARFKCSIDLLLVEEDGLLKPGAWFEARLTKIVAHVYEAKAEEAFLRRFMGKMEGGDATTTTDPAMARGAPALGHEDAAAEAARVHPPMPPQVAALDRAPWSETFEAAQCGSARGRFKDACWDYWHGRDEL